MPDLPPGSQPPPPVPPPPMAPPPAAPQPAAAPPPQPKKSSALKWILIGCGVLAGLTLLVCGGLALFGVWAVGKGKQAVEAWQKIENSEEDIRKNVYVQQKLGAVKNVHRTSGHHGDREARAATMTFHVTGERGEGDVQLNIEIEGIAPKVVKRLLYYDGKSVDLDTGAETEEVAPPSEGEND